MSIVNMSRKDGKIEIEMFLPQLIVTTIETVFKRKGLRV